MLCPRISTWAMIDGNPGNAWSSWVLVPLSLRFSSNSLCFCSCASFKKSMSLFRRNASLISFWSSFSRTELTFSDISLWPKNVRAVPTNAECQASCRYSSIRVSLSSYLSAQHRICALFLKCVISGQLQGAGRFECQCFQYFRGLSFDSPYRGMLRTGPFWLHKFTAWFSKHNTWHSGIHSEYTHHGSLGRTQLRLQ